MRICFISRRYFPAVSGMSVYARNMSKALAELGHEVVMISQYREDAKGVGIYGGGPPPKEPWMEVHGLRSTGEEIARPHIPADFEGDTRTMVDKALELHAERPFDVVHAQYCYPTGLAALEVSARLGIPNVVSIQGGDGHWVGLCCETHHRAMRAVLGHAMSLIIGCDSFRAEVHENHGTPLDRFTIIPGATNTRQFKPLGQPGTLRTPARLLYHGRVDSRKGSLDFIKMGKRLLDEGHSLRLIVSGIGPDAEATRDLAYHLGIGAHCDFLGAAAYVDAARRYHEGDIFVSPTYAEGFSNTILEAMASGLPIVSTNSVGVVDCLRHGDNGLLVEPGDVDALVEATRAMLTDDDLRVGIATRAYEEVQRKYSWPVVARQIVEEYERVLEIPVDTDWQSIISTQELAVNSDQSCRFRAEPHLL